MNKRLLAIALIILGIIGIFAVIWFFLFRSPATTPVQQPTQNTVTPSQPFNPSTSVPVFVAPTGTPPNPDSAEEKERQAQEKVRRIASSYASRLGTFSADDGFEAIRDVQAIATPTFQQRLETLREEMLKTHAIGSHWSQEVRAVTNAIEPSSLPMLGKSKAVINVQAQRTIGATQDYLNIQVTLVAQGDNWLVDDAVFTTFER